MSTADSESIDLGSHLAIHHKWRVGIFGGGDVVEGTLNYVEM
jgi:hypothetical protein